MKKFKISLTIINLLIFFTITQCGIYKKTNTREIPTNAQERARKAVDEGKGIAIGNVFKGGKTNYEFSSSNPLWRATIDLLDFAPFSNVDYSGGIIITDWYNGDNVETNEFLKITVRFLSNEIRADGLDVIVHKKKM